MRNLLKVMALSGLMLSAGAHAQAMSTPSYDEHQTADKAVSKMVDSHRGKPVNNNKSGRNLRAAQPDQPPPAAPKTMVPTGEVSSKVPYDQRRPKPPLTNRQQTPDAPPH